MKKLIVITIALVVIATTSASAYDACGSAFGNFATAKAMGQGEGTFGGGVGIGDNATSFVGWFNYGLAQYIDGRVKLGIIDPDYSDSKITFGGDIRYQIWDISDAVKRPFDMALGGLFEYVSYDGGSVWQLGGLAIGSYPFELSNGTTISPYGRFNVRLEGSSPDKGDSENKIRFGINGGAAWQISPTINIYGEFQVDGNDGIFLGIDFSVL
jgi:hypothetical protein